MAVDGIINVLKPPGMTSHDVVAYLRGVLHTKKIGHTGTLDPAVAGVLPICVGKATRIIEYINEAEKVYRGEMTFGFATDTQDAMGNVTHYQKVKRFSPKRVEETLNNFVGKQQQIPPMVSAVHYQGKKLYEWAREGKTVERPSRTIDIKDIKILQVILDNDFPRVLFEVACSKGTYVRTLVSDIGQQLGWGAMLSFLVRTRSGCFGIDTAVTLKEIAVQSEAGCLKERLLPLDYPLQYLSKVTINLEGREKISHGMSLGSQWFTGLSDVPLTDRVRVYDSKGVFIAIAKAPDDHNCQFKPLKVFL